MIVETRYRDIPWEEAVKCMPVVIGDPVESSCRRDWETKMRGQPVAIIAAPVQTPSRFIVCGGPFYRRAKRLGSANVVCPHIAEIGD